MLIAREEDSDYTEEILQEGIQYYAVVYTKKAQEFIVSNMEAILNGSVDN